MSSDDTTVPASMPASVPIASPSSTSSPVLAASALVDPIRVKRAKVAKWTLLANRVGYLFVALAMALFVMAFVLEFNSVMATLVIISFVIGCVLLAPSIVLGYAVKAAEREDRERGL
jgi:lipopolysaccharide export LptBFGC system permease protein LptF